MSEILGTGTTSTPAVKGLNTGTSPDEGRGVWGQSSEHDGVAGYSSAVDRFSGYFKNLGDGWGVYGDTFGEERAALWGAASGEGGAGVRGDAYGTYGYGVVATSVPPYWALYSIGHCEIDGTMMVSSGPYFTAAGFLGDVILDDLEVETGYSKSFVMDHPLDPANRILRHACVEAPEATNMYEGTGTADLNGELVVQLPAYFESINRDPRYQLTPLGQPAPHLHIKAAVADGRFVVAGARPNQRISWQVTGRRADAASKRRPFVAELEKASEEKGRYLAPAAYGHGPEKGLLRKKPPPPPLERVRPVG